MSNVELMPETTTDELAQEVAKLALRIAVAERKKKTDLSVLKEDDKDLKEDLKNAVEVLDQKVQEAGGEESLGSFPTEESHVASLVLRAYDLGKVIKETTAMHKECLDELKEELTNVVTDYAHKLDAPEAQAFLSA